MKAIILITLLLAAGCSKVETVTTDKGLRHQLTLKLMPHDEISDESFDNFYILGILRFNDESFIQLAKQDLEEKGFENPNEILDNIELIAYPRERTIELRLKYMYPESALTIVARAYIHKSLVRSVDGQMAEIERKRIKLDAMLEEIEQLPASTPRHKSLASEIEAQKELLNYSGGVTMKIAGGWRIE